MGRDWIGKSLTSRLRVLVLTALGTLVCMVVALAYDSFSFAEGEWRLGPRPWNNVLIPLILAPPFFYLLLAKLRALSIAHHRLEIVASTDSLTSCLNRAAFATLVEAYLEKFGQHPEHGRGALLVIDVDHFKDVNDTHGHDSGDVALKLIAGAIRSSLRQHDLVGRLGGEEFSVFLPGASAVQSETIADRICRSVQELVFVPDGRPQELSVSVGGTVFTAAASFSSLYRLADQRLYEAKRLGRNRVALGLHHPPSGPPLQ